MQIFDTEAFQNQRPTPGSWTLWEGVLHKCTASGIRLPHTGPGSRPTPRSWPHPTPGADLPRASLRPQRL